MTYPTLEEFEDMLIDDVCRMSNEEIAEELRQAGIDMGPAIEKMRAMIDKKKAELAAAPLGDPEEMPDYDCPFCDEAMYHEVKWNIGDFMMDRYRCENCKGSATKQTLVSAPMAESNEENKCD